MGRRAGDRLAERCGYTAPTIYHYFGDKEGLWLAVLEAAYEHIRAVRAIKVSEAGWALAARSRIQK